MEVRRALGEEHSLPLVLNSISKLDQIGWISISKLINKKKRYPRPAVVLHTSYGRNVYNKWNGKSDNEERELTIYVQILGDNSQQKDKIFLEVPRSRFTPFSQENLKEKLNLFSNYLKTRKKFKEDRHLLDSEIVFVQKIFKKAEEIVKEKTVKELKEWNYNNKWTQITRSADSSANAPSKDDFSVTLDSSASDSDNEAPSLPGRNKKKRKE